MSTPPEEGLRAEFRTRRFSQGSMNFGIPTKEEAVCHTVDEHGHDSWRTWALKTLHSTPVEIALIVLLLMDVIILFIEIFLSATYPSCKTIERDAISCCPIVEESHGDEHLRFLAGSKSDHHYCPEGFEQGSVVSCDGHKWHNIHVTEEVLFYLTITILSLFFIELSTSIIILTPCVFFKQFFFLADFVVVTVSLVLELVFHFVHEKIISSLVGLLVIARIWRFIRIGHGLIEATHKWSQHEQRKHSKYVEELESICRRSNLEMPKKPKGGSDHHG